MRNTILVAILVFLIVLFGGGAIVWYFNAEGMKKSIQDLISDINDGEPYITYSSIEASGFPFALNVSVVNPRFTGGVDNFFLKTFEKGKSKEDSSFKFMRGWSEDVALDGKITVGSHILSNSFLLNISGNLKDTTTVTGKPTFIAGQAAEEINCVLRLSPSMILKGGTWSVDALSSEKFLDNISALECNIPSSTIAKIRDGTSNVQDKLFSAGPQNISLTQTIVDDFRHIQFSLHSRDAEFTRAGAELLTYYQIAFNPYNERPSRADMTGAETVAIEGTYSAPLAFEDIFSAPITLDIPKIKITNAIATHEGSVLFENSTAQNTSSINLHAKLESSPKEGFDHLVLQTMHDMLHYLYVSNDPRVQSTQKVLNTIDEDKAHQYIVDAIPRFEPLQKLSYELNGTYNGSADMTSGNAILKSLKLEAMPYGITANANIKRAPQIPYPTGELNLNCRSCVELIDDLADYANRVQMAYAKFSPENAAPYYVKPAKVEALKSFLAEVASASKQTTAEDYAFGLKNNSKGEVSLNERPISELLTLYKKYFPAEPAK